MAKSAQLKPLLEAQKMPKMKIVGDHDTMPSHRAALGEKMLKNGRVREGGATLVRKMETAGPDGQVNEIETAIDGIEM